MDPDPVAGALYVLEDLERRPLARLEGPRVHALRLDGAHGRPRRGVVPRRGYRPHRGLDAGLAHRLARQQRDVMWLMWLYLFGQPDESLRALRGREAPCGIRSTPGSSPRSSGGR